MLSSSVGPSKSFRLSLTDEVVMALRATASQSELASLMNVVAREMGFRHYALIHHDDLRKPRTVNRPGFAGGSNF